MWVALCCVRCPRSGETGAHHVCAPVNRIGLILCTTPPRSPIFVCGGGPVAAGVVVWGTVIWCSRGRGRRAQARVSNMFDIRCLVKQFTGVKDMAHVCELYRAPPFADWHCRICKCCQPLSPSTILGMGP